MPKIISEKSKSQPETKNRTEYCVGCRGSFTSRNFRAHAKKCAQDIWTADEREEFYREVAALNALKDRNEAALAHAHYDDFGTADTAAPPLKTFAEAVQPFEMPKISAKSKSKSTSKSQTGTDERKRKECPVCQARFLPQNFRAHVNKCEREKRIAEGRREYQRERTEMAHAHLATWKGPDDDDDEAAPGSASASNGDTQGVVAIEETRTRRHDTPPRAQAGDASPPAWGFTTDQLRFVECPSSSQRYAHVSHIFEAYRSGAAPAHRPSSYPRPPRHSDSDDPWWQQCFETREDFLLAGMIGPGVRS